jgi:hypothetical protein
MGKDVVKSRLRCATALGQRLIQPIVLALTLLTEQAI